MERTWCWSEDLLTLEKVVKGGFQPGNVISGDQREGRQQKQQSGGTGRTDPTAGTNVSGQHGEILNILPPPN